MNHEAPSSLRRLLISGAVVVGLVSLGACSSSGDSSAGTTVAGTAGPTTAAAGDGSTSSVATTEPTTTDGASDTTGAPGTTSTDSSTTTTGTGAGGDLGAVGSLQSSEVHELTVTFDQAAYEAMIATYTSTQEKEWIEATVTIDGTTYERVGMRLKGNSSLRGIAGGGAGPGPASDASADDPASLPWLVDLDQFVDGQNHDGLVEFVVRSNGTSTSLNEAVALELLEQAGLASQDAVAVRLSVNGGEPELRLVIDNPDDVWMAEALDDSGALYKAESTGDYSYRGDDPEAYDEVFDQEAGTDNADLTPLIEFLQFVNESDDATFAAELADHLDVDAFATYLAMQQLLDNFDDIDGPGNNSYLYYDTASGTFTVVPWDYNLAFGIGPGGGGPGGGFPGGGAPGGGDAPTPPGGGDVNPGGGFGPGGRTNVLVERFLAVDEWNALYEQKIADLTAALYTSGVAADVLADWVAVVESSGLVDAATVQSEADQISADFS